MTANLWPMMTDGDLANPGPWYINQEHNWKWFFTSSEPCAWGFGSDIMDTPMTVADKFGCLWIHNPGGHDGRPMDMQQMPILTAVSNAHPDDMDLKAKADWDSFTKWGSAFSQWRRLAIYLGQPQSLKPTHQETPIQWMRRALETFRPVLNIHPKPLIAFDATLGTPFKSDDPVWSVLGGRNGGVALMIDHLQQHGYEVLAEPAIREDCDWASSLGLIMTDNFRDRWPDKWYIKDDGEMIPLIPPAEQEGKLVEYVRVKYQEPDNEKIAKYLTCLETGWDCLTVLHHIPDEFEL